MLIIVCGLPGTGKTTLAKAISRRLGAAYLSSDVLRKRMFPDPSYSEEERGKVYDELVSLCRKALAEGKHVVVDATFYKAALREGFVALGPGSGTHLILCTLDEDRLRKRLGNRKPGGPSDADFAVHQKLKADFEPVSGRHLLIDSALPLRRRLELVARFIGGQDG